MDDFNSLLLREQVELLRAQCARTRADRMEHCKQAKSVGRLIEEHEFPYRSLDKSGHRQFDPHIYERIVVEETAH